MSRSVRVLVPVGMLGAGFPATTVTRGIALGADIIAVDAGSTDSGPHYLGTATSKAARAAVARDLDILVPAARAAGIPLVVGSCGTCGSDDGVDWVHDIVAEIAVAHSLTFTVARIYSEQRAEDLEVHLADGRIRPLEPAGPLSTDVLRRCSHIVGLMGHEPLADALRQGADVVLAGRSTDTALGAVLPLIHGMPPGPAWHAAKIAECGGLATEDPRSGGVLLSVDHGGFTIEPLAPETRCTPRSVAAHMLYENADPFRMREPSGTLDTSNARYTAVDERSVRVEGSRFEAAEQATIKLEGAAPAGYQTMLMSAIRDPRYLERLDEWCTNVMAYLNSNIPSTLKLGPDDYDLNLVRFGHDAVLGHAEPHRGQAPREVCLVLTVTAADQETATQIAKFANPAFLHAPLDDHTSFPTFAFFGSPAETERGQQYEFVLQHAVDVADERSLFRTTLGKVGA
ncbi:acyclic terpene utilization AtuA family protein [Streptomyces longwoodensis]|uniref:acyclic terpene utilization AtuA family protein n=1 Tax=Streptomyces longwoodensis TaxID=68231 RepID=UPI0033CA4D32